MPSRKKAKGKARKAAKKAKAKAKEEESRAVGEVAANQRQEGSLEEQMQRLRISALPGLCRHGCPPSLTNEEKICREFIKTFIIMTAELTHLNVVEAFVTATDATAEEYVDVYSSKLNTVISILLARGTHFILGERNDIARLYASLACYLGEFIAAGLKKTKASPNFSKVIELYYSDDHTLVSYYRNRISCSCLDEKYKEVKSIKKMGCCYNPNCSHPDGSVERSKMLSCTRCGMVNYCSVECQKFHWKEHKQICGNIAEMKVAFNSSQT